MAVNRKKITKNAFRITKDRGLTAARIRVPGGHLKAHHLSVIQEIADDYGNGSVHITTRQGFEIPGIPFDKMDEINEKLRPLIKGILIDGGVPIDDTGQGYPAAGTRNIAACIGDSVCPYSNCDTTEVAKHIERTVYPNDFHVKIAVTGCPNDCIKAHTQDFGVVGMVEPLYDADRCITCAKCVQICKRKATDALAVSKGLIVRDHELCIGCGECVRVCPTSSWSRNTEKYFRLVIMGRTGKRNPRMAETFVNWVSEETVLKIIKNTYDFIDTHIDRKLAKEHVGYIVDRAGYQEFKKFALKDVDLGELGIAAEEMSWGGYKTAEISLSLRSASEA